MAHSSTGVDSVVHALGQLDIQPGFPEILRQELRFLKIFISCLTKCEGADKDINLTNAIVSIEAILKEADVDSIAPDLCTKFEQFEPEIKRLSAVLLDSLKSFSCSGDEILEFINCLSANFQDLANIKADLFLPVMNQIMVLGEKLSFLRILVDFSAKRCTDQKMLEDFLDYVKDLVQDVALMSLLFLLKGKDEMIAQGLETTFLHLLQKFKPCTPESIWMYVRLLKASKSTRSDKFQSGEIVIRFVDFLLEGLVVPLKDHVEILKQGLIFMIAFLMDPKEEALTSAEDGLFTQVDLLIAEVLHLISSFCMDKLVVLDSPDLQEKIEKVKADIRTLYVPVLRSSEFNFPMTNGMGFINFFLDNLEEMMKKNPNRIAFAKHEMMLVHKELLSFKPLFKDIMELQIERRDLKDFWRQIINVVFLAEHVITSCLTIDHPIWYDLFHLSDVLLEIKLVEMKLKKCSNRISEVRMSRTVTSFGLLPMRQVYPSSLDAVVGWRDETKTIIEKLKRGTTQLDIVSIVGMPGLGKTTIAKKVYHDPSIKYFFNRRAWSCVSQVYKRRELYLDILTDVTGVDARESDPSSTDDDLAETLRKSLKQQKYLVVLDDIWNIEAWDCIKDSFPDDNNGSRIIFTSRIHNLVSQAKLNCSPHPLRRSLVILSERSSNGGIKACRVHDLIHELCLAKIQEDNFLFRVHDSDVSHSSPYPRKYENYRLFIHSEWTKFIDIKPAGPFVHSLVLVHDIGAWQVFPSPSTIFNCFKLLNVLDLEYIVIDGPFPEEVTLMVHLRYLAIHCHATALPPSIANLWSLETLIVKGSAAEIPLPSIFWQMKSLRQVYVPELWLYGLEDHEYGQLEHLDIFSTPHLNSGDDTKELLRRLPGLRKLKCNFLERRCSNDPYKFPELSRLTGLEALKVYSYGIVFFGENHDQFPAFDFPSSLRRLTLGRFSLPWNAISIIGQLPNLEVLKLRSRAFSGRSWDVEDGEFINLKSLELRQLDIQEWTVKHEPFPNLERLIVKDCYSLGGIPSGLGYIPTLKKIDMRWCFQASRSAREILEEQQEMGNDFLEVTVFG
ncbi:OLC1v1014900C1 [Oldenlandia corymbosa var. corymbosa]|uniref:OLC1v1014900C1 n=1 Tax=Oldenlandia corymbosa var. corymbosa TaxID=529605 RepID=A0AAV1E204_OLDCO|nr:OLC1v1014900C1 [Oldenlandia corymbosa var. corymbosa]